MQTTEGHLVDQIYFSTIFETNAFGLMAGAALGLLIGLYAFKKNPIPPDMYHWWFLPLFNFMISIGLFLLVWSEWALLYSDASSRRKTGAIEFVVVCSIGCVYFLGAAFYKAWKNEFQFRLAHLFVFTTLVAISLWVIKTTGVKPFAIFFTVGSIAGGFGYNVACQLYRIKEKRK